MTILSCLIWLLTCMFLATSKCLSTPLICYVFPLRSMKTFIIIHVSKCILYYLDAHIFHRENPYNMSAPSLNLCSPRLLFLFFVIIAFYIQIIILGGVGDFSSLFFVKGLFLIISELKMDLAAFLCDKYKTLLWKGNGTIKIIYNSTTQEWPLLICWLYFSPFW